MATKQDKIEMLEAGLAELKSIHSAISNSYDSIKAKALALLAGEIGIITFLFANSSTLGDKVTPNTFTISTAIFYLIGIILLSLAFILFMYVVAPVQWRQPPETLVIKNLDEWFDNNREKFLRHLHQEYLEAISICNSKLSIKAKRFVLAVYMLMSGILILVLLKYGKGTITL